MGYALFTARKMSLQAKVNQYNLKLMQIANKENELTNKTAARQAVNNAIDNGQNTAKTAGSTLGTIAGGVVGGLIGGIPGALLGSTLGSSAGEVVDLVNSGVDAGQNKAELAYQTEIAAEQQKLDTEKQRINTLLTAAQKELTDVEKLEQTAIQNSSPKYVA